MRRQHGRLSVALGLCVSLAGCVTPGRIATSVAPEARADLDPEMPFRQKDAPLPQAASPYAPNTRPESVPSIRSPEQEVQTTVAPARADVPAPSPAAPPEKV